MGNMVGPKNTTTKKDNNNPSTAYFHPQFAPHSFLDSPVELNFPVLDEIMCW